MLEAGCGAARLPGRREAGTRPECLASHARRATAHPPGRMNPRRAPGRSISVGSVAPAPHNFTESFRASMLRVIAGRRWCDPSPPGCVPTTHHGRTPLAALDAPVYRSPLSARHRTGRNRQQGPPSPGPPDNRLQVQAADNFPDIHTCGSACGQFWRRDGGGPGERHERLVEALWRHAARTGFRCDLAHLAPSAQPRGLRRRSLRPQRAELARARACREQVLGPDRGGYGRPGDGLAPGGRRTLAAR